MFHVVNPDGSEARICRVGNQSVNYSGNNRVTSIGVKSVSYTGNRIDRVGNSAVSYINGRINRIGNSAVSYMNNRIDRIGNQSVSYETIQRQFQQNNPHTPLKSIHYNWQKQQNQNQIQYPIQQQTIYHQALLEDSKQERDVQMGYVDQRKCCDCALF